MSSIVYRQYNEDLDRIVEYKPRPARVTKNMILKDAYQSAQQAAGRVKIERDNRVMAIERECYTALDEMFTNRKVQMQVSEIANASVNSWHVTNENYNSRLATLYKAGRLTGPLIEEYVERIAEVYNSYLPQLLAIKKAYEDFIDEMNEPASPKKNPYAERMVAYEQKLRSLTGMTVVDTDTTATETKEAPQD